ncbi:hypothetical protein SAMN06269250_4080 [Spirosoma fluviale]|uniref:Uncharacterized protein n=1 Tax=Spirosoma fluviale TaxID=1597977 RepID=A0A286GBL6_9BACT|nr:hypothetical protein SAMN06269250_4080 [Spirosoma fluviale]
MWVGDNYNLKRSIGRTNRNIVVHFLKLNGRLVI